MWGCIASSSQYFKKSKKKKNMIMYLQTKYTGYFIHNSWPVGSRGVK